VLPALVCVALRIAVSTVANNGLALMRWWT
jgi:hypothetical protein